MEGISESEASLRETLVDLREKEETDVLSLKGDGKDLPTNTRSGTRSVRCLF